MNSLYVDHEVNKQAGGQVVSLYPGDDRPYKAAVWREIQPVTQENLPQDSHLYIF